MSCDQLLEGISLVSSLDDINVEFEMDIIVTQLFNITNGSDLLVEKSVQDFEAYPNDAVRRNLVSLLVDGFFFRLATSLILSGLLMTPTGKS